MPILRADNLCPEITQGSLYLFSLKRLTICALKLRHVHVMVFCSRESNICPKITLCSSHVFFSLSPELIIYVMKLRYVHIRIFLYSSAFTSYVPKFCNIQDMVSILDLCAKFVSLYPTLAPCSRDGVSFSDVLRPTGWSNG